MAYEPTEWKDGDIITAEKLNKIENNIGFYSINYIENEQGMQIGISSSYNEIINAINSGKIPIIPNTYLSQTDNHTITEIAIFCKASEGENSYSVDFFYPGYNDTITYSSTDPDAPMT